MSSCLAPSSSSFSHTTQTSKFKKSPTMATIELANLQGLRFQSTSPLLNQNSRCGSRTLIPPGGRRFSVTVAPKNHSRARRIGILKCSLVDQQEQQPVVEEASVSGFSKEECALIDALIGIQGRGRSASPQQLQDVERAMQVLEGLKGVPDPTSSTSIEGRWQLMFTTRPGTASPIQRTFVGVDTFTVFQEISLYTNDPRVSNIVKFSDAVGELKVEAMATIKDGKRILFQFDKAAFSFKFLPFRVPYPVPFRLLGDEAKGWLDTTYLSPSGNLRISRGNKGTTFVLQKETDQRQKLLSVISTGTEVRKAIDEFISLNQSGAKGELKLLEGEWKMIWSSQMTSFFEYTQEVRCGDLAFIDIRKKVETDSWIENAGNGLMGMQIVKPDGRLKFLVDILLGFKFSMTGQYVKSGTNTYEVKMDDAAIVIGPYGLPFEMETKITMELLYADDKIRISRGYNKILFVHVRVDGSK